jgi:hypothetical protein
VDFLVEGFFKISSAGQTLLETGKKKSSKKTRKKKEEPEEASLPGETHSLVLTNSRAWENSRLSITFEAVERNEKGKKRNTAEEGPEKGGAVFWIKVK